MGDRCYLEIRLHDKDVKRFCEIVKEGDPEDWACNIDHADGNSKTYCVDEVNYGWYDELTDVAAAGIIFSGYHGHGGNYGAYNFVSTGSSGVLYAGATHDANYIIEVQSLDDICSAVNGGVGKLQAFKAAMEVAEKHFESD